MLSDRDLDRIARALDRRRFAERDIEHRRFVRPLGRDAAVMKAREGGVEFVAASPGTTFRPGTATPTGSHTGRPGEFLLTTPAVGQRGVSLFPIVASSVEIPDVLNPLAWTSPGSILFTNGLPAFIDVVGVGDGFDFGMSVQIVNQSTPGQFTVSNLLVSSPTSIAFRVSYTSSPTPTTDTGDLRLITTETLEVEEFVSSEVS